MKDSSIANYESRTYPFQYCQNPLYSSFIIYPSYFVSRYTGRSIRNIAKIPCIHPSFYILHILCLGMREEV